MNVGIDIEFEVMRRKFDYGDFRFLQRNVHDIIPGGDLLTEFSDNDDEQLKALCCRAGMVMTMFGYPENASDMLRLNIGIPEEAHKHLLYVSSDSTRLNLIKGMDLDKIKKTDRDNWFTVFYAYLVSQWIDRRDIYKIIYYGNALFAPTALMAKPRESVNWTLLLSEQTFEAANMYSFDIKTLYKRAQELLKRFHFYGGNTEFYAAFQFHDFLPPSTTYALVAERMSKTDKESTHISALLIALYCPPIAIEDCIKQLR